MNNFYVYVYLDPRKSGNFTYGKYIFKYEPFYVGKGYGKRYLKHLQNSSYDKNYLKINKINKIKRLNLNPIIIKYFTNITETEAYISESDMIKHIGRIDIKNGPLTNLNDGGFGGHYNPSDELRYRFGSSTRGKTYEEIYGYDKSIILKNKRCESNKNRNIRKNIDRRCITGVSEINLDVTVKTKHNNIWVLSSPNNYVYITRNLLKTCGDLKIRRKSISELGRHVIDYYKGWTADIYSSNDLNIIKENLFHRC
jgi:hypothetical protein